MFEFAFPPTAIELYLIKIYVLNFVLSIDGYLTIYAFNVTDINIKFTYILIADIISINLNDALKIYFLIRLYE